MAIVERVQERLSQDCSTCVWANRVSVTIVLAIHGVERSPDVDYRVANHDDLDFSKYACLQTTLGVDCRGLEQHSAVVQMRSA